jgi:flavin-dependent dehydrogenase
VVTQARTDAVVIGGGPAGLAAALAARLGGFEVCLIDRGTSPIDKACGEGLMPDGVAALRRLGVNLGDGNGLPFYGIHFTESKIAATAQFPAQSGVGIRREKLHQILVDRAIAAGVRFMWQTRATAIEAQGVRIDGDLLKCRWIIGADGANSNCQRWAGLEALHQGGRRLGVRQHFGVKPWTEMVEVHWAKGEQAYVTPVGPEEICVALLGGAGEVRFSELASRFPRLGERLESAKPTDAVRGAMTGTIRLQRVTRGNIALVGDASATIDAVTGDGLTLAFRQALALGEALRQGKLALYEASHRRICRAPFLMANLLLLLDRHDGLRKIALQALASQPAIFDGLLAAHVGARHPVAASLDFAALGVGLLAQAAVPRSRSLAP